MTNSERPKVTPLTDDQFERMMNGVMALPVDAPAPVVALPVDAPAPVVAEAPEPTSKYRSALVTAALATFILGCALLGLVAGQFLRSATDSPAKTLFKTSETRRLAFPEDLTPSSPKGCQQGTLDAFRAWLGDEDVTWVWGDGGDEWWGLYYDTTNMIVVSTRVPCDLIPAVAAHEFSHHVTIDHTSGQTEGIDNVEIIADCGSLIVTDLYGGPLYSPYLAKIGSEYRCPSNELRQQVARDLKDAGVPQGFRLDGSE